MSLRVARSERAPSILAGGLITCRAAVSSAELAAQQDIRHAVFVAEQAVFQESDHDAHDDDSEVIHLLGRYAGDLAGAVRLFPLDHAEGLWQGDRLCVLRPYRVHGVGAPLVRCAVATAGAHGGTRMVAHIQAPNVAFFVHLGWHAEGDAELYVGLPHQRMSIDLPSPDVGARTMRELSAGIRH
ncbi:MSMEG_0567/Sll0786 family nitrogen starvation N-acetyltransferase [Leekyejoonella antrihumi]|uniref:MSMEG_0567/Sll0786 family nitrogen starvation N-acetyltransferase n=1 Tax=Leekyejoonella antrihumi TaxID=1660198 RepID=UPI001C94FCBF|nr:MSMEG_0567/Sll0786 family nitrogen starvation N-acetyltransferase [Leekyejoonella antrihumi]